METSEEAVAKIISKIHEIRKQKGYSSEVMAMDLGIATSTYNKVERMETELSLERFIKIKEILDVPYSAFFDLPAKSIYQQEFKDNAIGHYEVQTLYQENRDIYEKLIASKDDQIALLKSFMGKE